MSTRWKVSPFKTIGGLQTGLEGIDIPEDFDLPPCGIEDVDRAMFKLFNEDLPFYYEMDGDMKRIPCVFAGGERAMILRRKQPIRDRPVSYTHLRAHETGINLVCRLLLE